MQNFKGLILVAIAMTALEAAIFGMLSGPMVELGVRDFMIRILKMDILHDMAGYVWKWTRDVYEGIHYRFMRGGSKDTFNMDLRVWVRNNATPTYYSPGVGFRCVRVP
jgi:hypothetical protein